MSEDETRTGSIVIPDPLMDVANAGSLEDRMVVAEQNRETATTEDFPIPGWTSVAWVRLKVIGHKLQRKQVEQNRRVRDRATLDIYVAADTILAATDGFYMVEDDGETLTEDHSLDGGAGGWRQLGIGVKKMGQQTTPRQALIRLIGDERVVPFYTEYIEWLQGEREKINQEQTEDFRSTP